MGRRARTGEPFGAMRTPTSGRLLALLAALALAGCGGSGRPAAPTTGAPPASPQAASTARPDCGEGIPSHTIRFRASDGLALSGAVVGSGPVGAVLIHEYPLDLC